MLKVEETEEKPPLADVTIVVIGNFNAAIFHPSWFVSSNLIREDEVIKDSLFMYPDHCNFRTSWFSFEVEGDRFVVSTFDAAKYLPLRDVVQGVFRLLEHTPIRSFGLNTNNHYEVESADVWHKIGHSYAPKDNWSKILETPGLRSMVVEGKADHSHANRILVKLEPSNKVTTGIYIQVNQHYDVPAVRDAEEKPSETLCRILDQDWQGLVAFQDEAYDALLGEFVGKGGDNAARS